MSDSDSTAVTNPAAPGPKKGLFGRAVDSFKPPIGQKGFVPERTKAAVAYPKVGR